MTEPFPGPGPYQHSPQPGQHGLQVGEGPATNAAGFITVGGHLFAPLQGLDANNPRMGGYGWLSPTDYAANGVPQTLHPGVDLNSGSGDCNSDEGAGVVAPLAGVVRAVLYSQSGEGNHVWLELDDWALPGPTWLHVDHLLRVDCYEGQRLSPGERFALCGRSGGWPCAHLHLELLPAAPAQGYWQWPYQWPREAVEAAYYAPKAWWDAAAANVAGAPPEVVTMLLEGWQLKGWVLADLYQQAGVSYNPDGATANAWCDELSRGVYRGRPRGEEHTIEDGVWQEFEQGVCVWRQSDGAVSWNG